MRCVSCFGAAFLLAKRTQLQIFSQKCLDQIEETLMYEGPQNVAAFIFETVTGTNGELCRSLLHLSDVLTACCVRAVLFSLYVSLCLCRVC